MSISCSPKDLLKNIGLVVLYVLLARLVVFLFASNDVVEFLWLSSGVALVVVLLGGYKFLPAVFLGALLGYWLTGAAVGFSLVAALRHAASVYLCLWLLKREGRFDPDLRSLGDFLRILLLAVGFGLFTVTTAQMLAWLPPELTGSHSFNQILAGQTLGIVVIMPLLLVWRRLPREWAAPWVASEAVLIFGVSFLVGQVVFLDWLHDSLGQLARGYWMYLIITWAAVRLGPHGMVWILAVSASQGLIGAQLGTGFFSNDIAKTLLSNYFFYTLILSIVGMALATYFNERKSALHELEQHRHRLEELVLSRTAELEQRLEQMTMLNQKLEVAQNQLLQSEKMASIGQLAAGVAHEINNPIGFVNSNLGSLKGQVDDLLRVLEAYRNAEPALAGHADLLAAIEQAKSTADLEFLQEDVVNLINESLDGVHRVKKIVDNLKNFSRIDSTEWQYASLEQGLESTLNIVWNEIKYKAEVRKDYAGLPEIECIASQLNQVFLNLMINAAYAIADRGVITLRTGFDESHVWVDVEDSGKGIKPEHLNKIFEPFFTTKPVGQGTGLGLSLAYGIIQRHHGRLEVRSELGKGTVFRVTLPRVRRVDEATVSPGNLG